MFRNGSFIARISYESFDWSSFNQLDIAFVVFVMSPHLLCIRAFEPVTIIILYMEFITRISYESLI